MPLRDELEISLRGFYTIERELGGGGMSRVFLASDARLERAVVVKVVAPDFALALSVQRFEREVRVAAGLQHPNIVPLLTAGEMQTADGTTLPYYTMPFVDGDSLRTRLATAGALPINEAVSLLRDVARSLAYAHARGVVHRDIKPENILVSNGVGLVTDFGIAKALAAASEIPEGVLTVTGLTVGTPGFMSPEQTIGDPSTDHRTDIYAFGCVAYELLAGKPPLEAPSQAELIRAHLTERPALVTSPHGRIPTGVVALIARCLEKSADARPHSAVDLLTVLDTTPAARAARLTPKRQVMIVSAVAAAAAVATVWYFRPVHRDTRPVAVIPLVAPDADPSQSYFVDGITEDLTSALAESPGLAVINRGSAYQFKGQAIDAREVSSKLGAAQLVEVRVRRVASRVRVSVDLVDGATGVVAWTKTADRAEGDASAFRDELASALVAELRHRSTGEVRRRHVPRPEAYDAYLRGKWFFNRGSEQDLLHALEYFDRATKFDTAFADPYAAAAFTWERLADGYLAPLQAYPHADSLARRAIALDSSNADGYGALAFAKLILHWDWRGAQADFEKALSFNPNSTITRLNYSIFWSFRGNTRRALNETQRCLALDPLSVIGLFFAAGYYSYLELPDSALMMQRRLDEIAPSFVYSDVVSSDIFRQLGLLDSALARDRAASAAIGHPTSSLVVTLMKLGRRREADAAFRAYLADTVNRYLSPDFFGRAALALGDTAQALRWLQRGIEIHSAVVTILPSYVDMRPFTKHPRYRFLLDSIGRRTPH